MKRKRGSVMLFVVVMVSMMTISILASVQLATSAAKLQTKRETDAKTRYAYEGAIQLCLTDYKNSNIALPNSSIYTVGDFNVKVTATDNSSAITRTVKVDGEVTALGKKYTFTRTVGNRKSPNPFYYSVFVNQDLDPTKTMTLGSSSANGDLCVNGSIIARANPFTINGDLEETGTTLPATAVVTGNTFKSAAAVPFPGFNKLLYLAASPIAWALTSLSGRGFPIVEPYQLVYRTGDLDLNGSFTGKGTIFVDGNVKINGNVSYGAAGARLVVIATGTITVDAAATSIVGFYWTPVEFKHNSASCALTSGSIATQKLTLGGPLTVTHDNAFWLDTQEAVKHRVPGFWP